MNINSSGTLAPIGYTWTPLASPTSSVANSIGGYTASIPGQYEAQFHDGNFCYVTTTVTIFIDTLRPSPASMTNLPSNSYTLNCFNPCLIATAITNPMLPPTSYSWTVPGPLTYPKDTISVCLGQVTSSTTPTNYTVLAMGANGCVGRAKVSFAKDIYIPPYTPVSTPSTGITCYNPCVAMSPSSSTTTPISFTFTSPAPTQTATTSGALMCVPGTYTMNYVNQLNGCGKTATTVVTQNVVPPGVNPAPIVYLPCGQTTTIISANTVTTSNTYSYTWEGPPGSAMSCLGGTACATPSVNMPGEYSVIILSTANGCSSTNSVLVVAGSINASFSPNPSEGYSPLSVTFNNTSQTGSAISGSITTLWNYGNGITYTTSGTSTSYSATGLPNGSTIYQSAGSYTVLLVVTQVVGTSSCVGTATAVVKVELPSKMEVPNVFTPNADGVNDVFMLQTTNLTEITLTIFDRWGVKMYDVVAEKGNVEWDGKNFGNKDVPAGTYFYILKAKGKDLKDYEQKGTISLYR
jgi:gliding motility-associated-like protein